jgi:hypothetical protein
MLDKLRKTEMLPTFSEMVGEVINIIEDPMSCATDPVKSTDPSIACEVARCVDAAYFSTCNSSNMSSIKRIIAAVGFQERKDDRECMIEIDPGNMFAKKIHLRDNFFGIDEFPNRYKNFIYIAEDVGTKLTPGEEVELNARI